MTKKSLSFLTFFLFIQLIPSLAVAFSSLDQNKKGITYHYPRIVLSSLATQASSSEGFGELFSDLLRGELLDLSQVTVLSKKETDRVINRYPLTPLELIQSQQLTSFQSLTQADWLIVGEASQIEQNFEVNLQAISFKEPNEIKKLNFKGGMDALSLTIKEGVAQIAKMCQVEISEEDKINLLKPVGLDQASLELFSQSKKEIAKGRTEEGAKLLTQILEKYPDFIEVSLTLSEIYFLDFKREKAVAVLRDALKENPNSLRLLTQMGHSYADMGSESEAKEYFERVLLISPYQSEGLFSLSQIYFKQQLYQLALDLAQKGVRSSSNKSRFYTLLGEVYQAKGDFVFALQMYQRALALDSKYKEALKKQGVLLALMGKYEKAESIYSQGIELTTEKSSSEQNLVESQKITYQNQELQEALEKVKNEPKNVLALNALGTAWQQEEAWGKAEESFKKAIELNPNFQPAYFNLAVNLGRQQKMKEADLYFVKSLELSPQHSASYLTWGDLYWSEREGKRALQIWEQGLTQLPNSVDLTEKLVHIYAQMDKWKKVIQTYEKLAEAKGVKSDASLWIGRLFLEYGKEKEGLEFLKKGLKEGENQSQPYKELARYYDFHGNDAKKAIEYYENYLKLETESQEKDAVQVRIAQLKDQLDN